MEISILGIHKRFCSVLVASAALICATSASGGTDFRALERLAFEHELHGRFLAAQGAFADALVAAASEAAELSRSGKTAAACDLWGWCEVLAENSWTLSLWTSKPGELLAKFEAARDSCASGVAVGGECARMARELSSWLTNRLSELAYRTGDWRRQARECAKLGFITNWRVIGPFENEKGGGFRTAYPPEREIDFAATYPGKKRPCGWRELPVLPPDGVIDLDSMFRPNEECIAYAVTFVRSRERREVELRVASDDGFTLWLNGKKLASRDVERACTFDQDVIPATLEAGWNQILLKIADMHVAWEFALRITDRGGAPLQDLEVSASSVRPYTTADTSIQGQVRVGGAAAYFQSKLQRIFECKDGNFLELLDGADSAFQAFAKAAGAAGPDLSVIVRSRSAAEWVQLLEGRARELLRVEVARLYYGLARLLTSRGSHGVKDHPDREALARALELDRANPVYIHALSRVSTDWTLMEAERHDSPRVRLLNELLRVEPRAAVAHYELASYYLRSQRSPVSALKHTSSALKLAPECVLAELVEVDARQELGHPELARVSLEGLAKRYPQDPIVQGRLAHELFSEGLAAEAAKAYRVAFTSDASVEAYRHGLVRSLVASGKLHSAVEELSRMSEAKPFDVNLQMELAQLHEAKGDYAAAAEIYRKGLSVAPEDHILLEKLGRCLQHLGRIDEARATWRRALEIEPNFVKLERYLEFLDGKLTYDRRFAEDVPALIEQARLYVPGEGDPLVEVLEKAIDRVYVDGTRSRTVHRLVMVRNSRGAELLGTPYIFFYPDEQVVKLKTIRVHRADGSVEDAPTGDARILKTGYAARSAMAIELPTLHPGDIVEMEYRVDDTRPSFFGKYFGETFHFQGIYPRLRAKYVLIAPSDMRLFFHTRGARIEPSVENWAEEQAVVYTWKLEPSEKIRVEPFMPPQDELGTQLQVSTFKDWKEFGIWYWNLVKDTHQTSREIEEKAKELTSGAKDELSKIRAIYDFVSSEIQYSAWEFGIHGFKPYKTTKIFDQRFGDCKDKAALMKTMLACIGVESYPALLEATLRRSEEDLSLPLFNHFNHMILYVPEKGDRKELWLDGTTTLHSMETIPLSNAGALACVIYEDGGKILRIPQEGPEGNSLSEEAEVELHRSRDKLSMRVNIRAKLRGWLATFARYRMNGQEAARRMLERLYSRQVPAIKVLSVSTSNLEDIAVPVSYEVRAIASEFGTVRPEEKRGAGRWFFKNLQSPFRGAFSGEWALLAPENLSDYATLGEREHDLVLSAPWRHESRVTYTLPEGLEFKTVPEDAEFSGPFGRFSVKHELNGRKLTVIKLVELSTSRIKAADYVAFRAFVNRADRAEKREIGVGP